MRRRPWLASALLLAALPLVLLRGSVLGERRFLPFDQRVFSPYSLALPDAELEQLRSNANLDITETTLVNAPELRLARDDLRRGRLPSWDPYARLGAPLFANMISGLASPLGLPRLLLEPERALALSAWLAAALAGWLMLGLLRELGLSWRGGLFGAIAFSWSGTMAARWHLFVHCETLLWLPAMLWSLERLRGPRHTTATAALAVATLMTWTAGYPPLAVASTLVAGVWLLVRAAGRAWRQPRDGARLLVAGAAGFAAGFGLAAYALAPMIVYFGETGRTAEPALVALRRTRTLDPAGWLNLLLESPFSTPALNRAGGVPHNKAPLLWLLHSRAGTPGVEPLLKYTEHRMYTGAMAAIALPFALAARARATALSCLLGAGTLLVLASGNPLFDALGVLLPPLRYLQPMALMPPAACLLAVAAALGFERLFERGGAARRAAAALAALLAVGCTVSAVALATTSPQTVEHVFLQLMRQRWGEVFAASGPAAVRAFFEPALGPAASLLVENLRHAALWFGAAALCLCCGGRWPRAAAMAATLLCAAELVLCALPLDRTQAEAPGDTAVHGFLRRARARYAPAGGFAVARVAAPFADGRASVPESPLALPPDLLLDEHIRDLNAYTFLDGRSHLPLGRLYAADAPPLLVRGRWFGAFPDDARLRHGLFDLFGVRYLLCEVGPGRRPPRHAGELAASFDGPRGSFEIRERARPCPRAFVVPRATVLADDDAVLAAMTATDFAPRDQVLVTAADAAGLGPTRGDAAGGGSVRFALDEGSHLMLQVDDCGGGYLVLADSYLSGWTATVDGIEIPIVRGDLCLRAVPVPRGTVRVDFRYRPPGLLSGVAVSVLTALGGLWWLWRRRWSRPFAAPS